MTRKKRAEALDYTRLLRRALCDVSACVSRAASLRKATRSCDQKLKNGKRSVTATHALQSDHAQRKFIQSCLSLPRQARSAPGQNTGIVRKIPRATRLDRRSCYRCAAARRELCCDCRDPAGVGALEWLLRDRIAAGPAGIGAAIGSGGVERART